MNITDVEDFAKTKYLLNNQRHQWHHIEEVMGRALEIAEEVENVDFEILKLAVIFHDIDYHTEKDRETNYNNHVENSMKMAEEWLRKQQYPEERLKWVLQAMLEHSTPHRKKIGDAKSVEGKILYDADKSLFITTKEKYDKYNSLLYFDISKRLVSVQES